MEPESEEDRIARLERESAERLEREGEIARMQAERSRERAESISDCIEFTKAQNKNDFYLSFIGDPDFVYCSIEEDVVIGSGCTRRLETRILRAPGANHIEKQKNFFDEWYESQDFGVTEECTSRFPR